MSGYPLPQRRAAGIMTGRGTSGLRSRTVLILNLGSSYMTMFPLRTYYLCMFSMYLVLKKLKESREVVF